MRALRPGAGLGAASLALLLLLGAAEEAAAGESCARCVGRGGAPATCAAACPAEILAVLAGKTRITRRSPDLANDCLALEPIHPMVLPENRRRLSKPLDRAELEHVLAFGYRTVRALPGCAGRSASLPAYVLLGRPLSADDALRDDGTKKPTVRVDRSDPSCVSGDGVRLSPAGPPACDVRTAAATTRRSGGTIIEIAGGSYPEPRRIPLGHGHVLVARDDEPVTLTGWIDVSGGAGPARLWTKASEDATGALFVLDWSAHGDAGGAAGLRLPLELDGRALAMALHFDPSSRAADVEEIVLASHDVGAPGAAPVFLYANPDHPAACMDSGLNVKSGELACEQDGLRVPCAECRARGIPVQHQVLREGACRPHPGTCAPVASFRTVKLAARETCRRVLGAGVSKCLLLKLPRGDAPGNHRLRSSHTDHGLVLSNDERRAASGVVLRGLRLEKVPVSVSAATRITARSGLAGRLDALELEASSIYLAGGHVTLENSFGREGKLIVSGPHGGLAEMVVRNNVFDRYYGKPISWGESRQPEPARAPGREPGPEPGPARWPARLHELAPLCETGTCATPGAPVLFSGAEDLAGWRGWSRILFNLIRHGAAINAFGPMSYTVVAGNVFEHGDIQEGIVDLPFGARHVWIHHNWSSDGLGTGIKVMDATEDLLVTDNQLHRSPGDLAAGAGSDRSATLCRNPRYRCWGVHRSILLRPGDGPCREVTLENNLSSASRHGGIAVQACDGLTLRNNTATGSQRLHELVFIGSRRPATPARILDNVASDAAQPGEPAASHHAGEPYPFRVGEARGNYLGGCDTRGAGCPPEGAPLLATDPAWSGAPAWADPAADDFHLLGGWRGRDGCASRPPERYAHPGFNYADELCARRAAPE